MRIRKFKTTKDNLFYYQFLTKDGDLIGGNDKGYPTKADRNNAFQKILECANDNKNILNHIDSNGHQYFEVVEKNKVLFTSTKSGNDQMHKAHLTDFTTTVKDLLSDRKESGGKNVYAGKKGIDDYKPLDFYTQHSKGVMNGFTKIEENGEHFFSYSKGGKVMLMSQGYTSTSGRDNGISSVQKNMSIAKHYQIQLHENGKYYFNLIAGNNQEIATSIWYKDKSEVENIIRSLSADGSYVGTTNSPSSGVVKEKKDKVIFAQGTYGNNNITYQIFKSNNDKFYFTFKNKEGKTLLLNSNVTGFESGQEAQSYVDAVIKHGGDKNNYESKTTKNGKYYCYLKNDKGENVAKSFFYGTENEMKKGVDLLLTSTKRQGASNAGNKAAAAGMGAAGMGVAGLSAHNAGDGMSKGKDGSTMDANEKGTAGRDGVKGKDGLVVESTKENSSDGRNGKGEVDANEKGTAGRDGVKGKDGLAVESTKENSSDGRNEKGANKSNQKRTADGRNEKSTDKSSEKRTTNGRNEKGTVAANEKGTAGRDGVKGKDGLAVESTKKISPDGRNGKGVDKSSEKRTTDGRNEKGANKSNEKRTTDGRNGKGTDKSSEKRTADGRNEKSTVESSEKRTTAGRDGIKSQTGSVSSSEGHTSETFANDGYDDTTGGGGGCLKWLFVLLLLAALLGWFYMNYFNGSSMFERSHEKTEVVEEAPTKTEEIIPATPTPPTTKEDPVGIDSAQIKAEEERKAAEAAGRQKKQAERQKLAAEKKAAEAKKAAEDKAKREAEAVAKRKREEAAKRRTGASIFEIPDTRPVGISELGRNPQFGDSRSLSADQFYEKLNDRYNSNNMDKAYLNYLYKQMGYANGWADAKASHFESTTLRRGQEGILGFGSYHGYGYYKLNVSDADLQAFRVQAASGCDVHFMKRCGNYMYFCE